jgi:DNA (cytosine-5)-methyltransferase 1
MLIDDMRAFGSVPIPPTDGYFDVTSAYDALPEEGWQEWVRRLLDTTPRAATPPPARADGPTRSPAVATPKLLDLYCKAGGATKGYQRAGFHVTGLDIEPQPRYCGDAFVQADAIEYVIAHGHEYDFIHASPVCQRYSRTKSLHPNEYPDLIPATRAALIATGRPYVIENVVGAPLIEPVSLCGRMFGLPLYRHRLFECSFFLLTPSHPAHTERTTSYRGPDTQARRNAARRSAAIVTVVGHNFYLPDGVRAMGIDWMNRRELSQAIPPAYSEFIGRAWLDAWKERAA